MKPRHSALAEGPQLPRRTLSDKELEVMWHSMTHEQLDSLENFSLLVVASNYAPCDCRIPRKSANAFTWSSLSPCALVSIHLPHTLTTIQLETPRKTGHSTHGIFLRHIFELETIHHPGPLTTLEPHIVSYGFFFPACGQECKASPPDEHSHRKVLPYKRIKLDAESSSSNCIDENDGHDDTP